MPCRDYESDIYNNSEIHNLKDRLDEVTKLLCYTLGNINNDAWFNGVMYRYSQEREPFDDLEVELMDWWKEHQRLDAEEAIRVKEEEEAEIRREKLIAKFNEIFTDEEQWDLKNIL